MTTVLCTCRVADFDVFRRGYDKALEIFGEHIHSWRLWRGQDDPNTIIIEEVFESRELAEAIWTDLKTKAAMEADGIDMSTVQIQYLDEVAAGPPLDLGVPE